MESYQTLNNLPPERTAVILNIESRRDISRRFRDIGLIEGTKISCVLKSPFGDPAAYMIRGALIAIRDDDAKHITLKLSDD